MFILMGVPAQNELYKKLLEETGAQIQEAKERINLSMASEEWIEQLSEKNMDLKEVSS